MGSTYEERDGVLKSVSSVNWIRVAIATFVVIVGLCGALKLIVPHESPEREKVSRVRSDMRSLATALESYFVDHDCYPAMGPHIDTAGEETGAVLKTGRSVPSLTYGDPTGTMHTLTTPVAYVTRHFGDPFAKRRGGIFGYYTDGPGWILFSPGPDKDYDINPHRDYDSLLSQPSPHLQITCTYDSTNGVTSDGDVWRVKE